MTFPFCHPRLFIFLFAFSGSHSLLAADIEGRVEPGISYLNNDAYRFGTVAGLKDQGLTPFLDFSLQALPIPASGDTAYWQVQGQNLGLNTGRLSLEAGQQGTQRFRLNYREISTYYANDALTPMRGAGSTTLSLPQGWQVSSDSTAGMTTLQENLVSLSQWKQRRKITMDYRRKLNPNWSLNIDFRRDFVAGTRALGGSTGATGGNVRAQLLPAPIEYEPQIAALSLAYVGTSLHWNMGYQGSFFNNPKNSLTWPTAFGQHPQWSPGVAYPNGMNQLALEPDNQAHLLNVSGSMVVNDSNRLYLDASLGRQTQNTEFLPYTVNSALTVNTPLPRGSLDGQVNTSRLNLRLTSRPLRRLNLVTRLAYRGRDNQSPIAAYQRVRGDAENQQAYLDARLNRPYSFDETTASADAVYRLFSGLRLEAGYEYSNTERDYSEISKMDEQSLKLGMRSTGFDNLAMSLDYRLQQRRTDDYVGNRSLISTHLPGSIGAEDYENHPMLRKYYLNARDREQWRLQTDWYLLTSLSLGASISYSSDEYPSGYFGLNDSSMRSITVDVAYTPDDHLRLSGFINQDRYHNKQSGRSFRGSVPADADNPNRNWLVASTDHFDTVGINLSREQISPRLGDWQGAGLLDLSLELSHSRATGEIDNNVASDLLSAPLPDLDTRLNSATLSARYNRSERSSLRFAVTRELYRSSDFALDNIAPSAATSVLLLGQNSPAYQVTWTTLGYRYQF